MFNKICLQVSEEEEGGEKDFVEEGGRHADDVSEEEIDEREDDGKIKSRREEEKAVKEEGNPEERNDSEKNLLTASPTSGEGVSSSPKIRHQSLWSRFFGTEQHQTSVVERRRRQAASLSTPLPEAEPTEKLLVEEPKKGPR